MAVQAAVFDYGKVISLPPEEGVMAELAALAGLPASLMERLVFQYRESYDRGDLDGEGYYRTILAQAGASLDRETVKKMVRLDIESWTAVNGDTVRLMEDIKAGGVKLGILSNMPWDFLSFARKHIPVFSLPDAGIFSCELSLVKPEPGIYDTLIAALDCEPGDIVFFDDIQANVDGALARGIRAFLWEGPEAARETLKGFGVVR